MEPLYKPSTKQWALTNKGNIWSVHQTRKQAMQEAERLTGDTWKKCREYFDTRKVTISEGWE